MYEIFVDITYRYLLERNHKEKHSEYLIDEVTNDQRLYER